MRTKLLAVLLLGLARVSHAAAGAEPFNFLFLDANARAVAMGGAYTALARDANALLYNPAGLGWMEAHEATFMHNEHVEGISQEYAAMALKQGFGASLNYVNLGRLTRTTVSKPAGGIGDFGAWDLALSGGYGRVAFDRLSLGAAVKYVKESIDDVSAQGAAFDLGALYRVPAASGLTLGLALQNIGPPVRYQSAREDLPLNLRMGGAYEFTVGGQRSALALDVTKERSEGALVAFGAETVAAKALALRLGYGTRNTAGPGVSVGLGWQLSNFSFDYAFVPFGDLGNAHRLSVTLRWGEGGSREERTYRPPAFKPAPKPKPEPKQEKKAPEAMPAPTPAAPKAPEPKRTPVQPLGPGIEISE